jgi:hypothetical protein
VFSLTEISSGTFSDKHSDRHTMRIHGQVYLGVEPPLCGPCPDCYLSHLRHEDAFDMTCIYHQPFKVRFINKDFKKFLPYSPVSPSAESPMGIHPVAEVE